MLPPQADASRAIPHILFLGTLEGGRVLCLRIFLLVFLGTLLESHFLYLIVFAELTTVFCRPTQIHQSACGGGVLAFIA